MRILKRDKEKATGHQGYLHTTIKNKGSISAERGLQNEVNLFQHSMKYAKEFLHKLIRQLSIYIDLVYCRMLSNVKVESYQMQGEHYELERDIIARLNLDSWAYS